MYFPVPFPHLRNNKLAGNQQRPQQVVSAIISHLIDGHLKEESELLPKHFGHSVCQTPEDSDSYLWAGENDGFAQMFTHEGQGRGRVSHSVCAVQDHKTIKVFIVFLEKDKKKRLIRMSESNKMFPDISYRHRSSSKYLNVLSNSTPVICSHIGGVQQRVVLYYRVYYPFIVFA